MFTKQIDNAKTLELHRKIIHNKTWLRHFYSDIYTTFKNIQYPSGIVVELGSGAGFIKEIIPNAITSDVIKGKNIDRVFSAAKIPFASETIAAFFLFDVLHHIKQPLKALSEMQRCLKPNGKIVMIEPYNSFWGRFIYQNFHHEQFDPGSDWRIEGSGRLSDANGALPWIIFVRDRAIFECKFPNLKVVAIKPHTPLLYLFSGGLTRPQLLPTHWYTVIQKIESLLFPLNNTIGMFVTIELQKI